MPIPDPAPAAQAKDAIRVRNLAAVLGEVRSSGPVARTELHRRIALGRTTVSEVVTQLAELGLVVETPHRSGPGAGRPGFVVAASPRIVALALDPESDGISAAAVALDGSVLAIERSAVSRPEGPERTVEIADELFARLRSRIGDVRVVGTGVGFPGQVDRATGRVLGAPRLGWPEVDLAGMLAARIGGPVAVDNNSRLAAQAEHRIGVARDVDDLLYVFGGAGGIGGGIVADGRVLAGKGGLAGEIGHLRISADGARDFGGIPGTLEALVRRDDLLAALGATDLTDVELDALLSASDDAEVARLSAAQLASLATALGGVANVLDPRMIVLGGFLGSLYGRFPAAFDTPFRDVALPAVRDGLTVVASVRAVEAVLVGAAELAFAPLLADPLALS